MAIATQPSFSSGEITPSAYGRIDLAKYQTGLKTCRNTLTRVHGGTFNRPGTEFVSEAYGDSSAGRLVPFIFSEDQAYVLAFTDFRMMVLNNGGLVLEAQHTIISVANTTPVSMQTADAHGFVAGDRVFISGTGIDSIDNRFWLIGVITADTFVLIGSVAPGIASTVGIVARAFVLITPYAGISQFERMVYAQLRDVMTVTMQDVRPKDISRLGHANWTIADMSFREGPFQNINADSAITMQPDGITGDIVVTAVGTTFTAEQLGMFLYLEQKDYGKPWEVDVSVNAGDLRRSEGKYYEALDSGNTGTLRPTNESDNWDDGKINWMYRHSGFGIVQIIGLVDSTHAACTVLREVPQDVVDNTTYKWALGAWGGDQGWPAVVTYFQQRKTFASTVAKPEGVWLSGTNSYDFFGRSSPVVDDDAVSVQLVGKRVANARHAFDLGKLIILTSGGRWVLPDDDNNPVLAPGHTSARQQGAIGASFVPPAIVEDTALYVEDRSQTAKDLGYQFSSNAFSGKDLSVLSKHLFEKHKIRAAAYQHIPWQVWWLVRDDGVLITCTYLKEQDVWGWHRHDTELGCFEDVAVIPEGDEDRVYFRVQRMVNGVSKRYYERLASRLYLDIKDAWFVDCGIKYDGRNVPPSIVCPSEPPPEPPPVVVPPPPPCTDATERGQQSLTVELAFDQLTPSSNPRTSWAAVLNGELRSLVGSAGCGGGNMNYNDYSLVQALPPSCSVQYRFTNDNSVLHEALPLIDPDGSLPAVNTRVGTADQFCWMFGSAGFWHVAYVNDNVRVPYPQPAYTIPGGNGCWAVRDNEFWILVNGNDGKWHLQVYDRLSGAPTFDYTPWGTDNVIVNNMNLTADRCVALVANVTTGRQTIQLIDRSSGTIVTERDVQGLSPIVIFAVNNSLIYILCSGSPYGSLYYYTGAQLVYVGKATGASISPFGGTGYFNSGNFYFGGNGFGGFGVNVQKVAVACPPLGGPGPIIAAVTRDANSVVAGGSIGVSWTDILLPDSTDRVQLAPVSATRVYNGATATQVTTGAATNGSVSLTVPVSTTPGNYEIQLVTQGGAILIAKSAPFAVT